MKLGIIGGIGPLAGYDFGKRLTKATPVLKDQDHINAILLSDSKIPDRTDFILGYSDESPLPKLKEDVKLLNDMNVDNVAILCNTAHYFYDDLVKDSTSNIYNIIDITMKSLSGKKVGLISTKGTRDSKIYEKHAASHNVELVTLDDKYQEIASSIIYEQVKMNKSIIEKDFRRICDKLFSKNCEYIILGCTELSTAKIQFMLNEIYVDPIDKLIERIICDYYGGKICADL